MAKSKETPVNPEKTLRACENCNEVGEGLRLEAIGCRYELRRGGRCADFQADFADEAAGEMFAASARWRGRRSVVGGQFNFDHEKIARSEQMLDRERELLIAAEQFTKWRFV